QLSYRPTFVPKTFGERGRSAFRGSALVPSAPGEVKRRSPDADVAVATAAPSENRAVGSVHGSCLKLFMLTPKDQRAARSLRRWLRRAVLPAISTVGLAGCSDNCGPVVTQPQNYYLDGGWQPSWSIGAEHSAAECTPYCSAKWGDGVCRGGSLLGC